MGPHTPILVTPCVAVFIQCLWGPGGQGLSLWACPWLASWGTVSRKERLLMGWGTSGEGPLGPPHCPTISVP